MPCIEIPCGLAGGNLQFYTKAEVDLDIDPCEGPSFSMKKLVIVMLVSLVFTVPHLSAEDPYLQKRHAMVEKDLKGRGIKDKKVLEVMTNVPRHLFVPEKLKDKAYSDHPLPIEEGQTISQPYVVALMTEALGLRPTDRVLEIGTGSGYQAAVLSGMAKEVYTIEIRKSLAETSSRRLRDIGYSNVKVRYADGYFGWQEYAPFDAIIITAFVNHIPPQLLKQLKEGGRLVVPLGNTFFYQTLTLLTKRKEGSEVIQIAPVAFVPMVGEIEKKK